MWRETLLSEVGRALAAFCDALADFAPPEPARRQLASPRPGPICRHDLVRRVRILLDAYGLRHRAGFIDAVIARAVGHVEGLAARAGEGIPADVEIACQGHLEEMRRNVAYLASDRHTLQGARRPDPATKAPGA